MAHTRTNIIKIQSIYNQVDLTNHKVCLKSLKFIISIFNSLTIQFLQDY